MNLKFTNMDDIAGATVVIFIVTMMTIGIAALMLLPGLGACWLVENL